VSKSDSVVFIKRFGPRPVSKLRPRSRRGRCFELSGRYQLDDPSWALVHGTIRTPTWGRFPHAWLKRDGWVYDSVLNRSYKVATYTRLFDARVWATYAVRDAAKVVVAAGHWGPFDEFI
jgi:hypothetical protein